MMQPLQDGKEPPDLTVRKSGGYNLGFVGIRDDRSARALIDWWASRCYRYCRVDDAGNMFTDQRWMDLAPAFLIQAAYSAHIRVTTSLTGTSVTAGCGKRRRVPGWSMTARSCFFISAVSIWKTLRHWVRSQTCVGSITSEFSANGWLRYSRLSYGFAAFADGRPIEDAMRHWLLRAIDTGRIDACAALTIDLRFFDQPDEVLAEKSIALTRFMYQYRLDRQDLQQAFDIVTPRGYDGYFDWFVGGEARRQGVDGRNIAAARRLRGELNTLVAPPPEVTPPWPSVSHRNWRGESRDVGDSLKGTWSRQLPAGRSGCPLRSLSYGNCAQTCAHISNFEPSTSLSVF